MIPDRVPLSIITGFLGSGKTTLIAALLKRPGMDNVAIIVNEFGAVGIDDAIFAQSVNADDVLLLANGCLCCSAGADLCASVWALAQIIERLERLLAVNPGAPVELAANGVIDPSKLFDASLYVARNGGADPERWLNVGAYHAQSSSARRLGEALAASWRYPRPSRRSAAAHEGPHSHVGGRAAARHSWRPARFPHSPQAAALGSSAEDKSCRHRQCQRSTCDRGHRRGAARFRGRMRLCDVRQSGVIRPRDSRGAKR